MCRRTCTSSIVISPPFTISLNTGTIAFTLSSPSTTSMISR